MFLEDVETELLMKISAKELKSVLENMVESKLAELQVHRTSMYCPHGTDMIPLLFLSQRWISQTS